MPVPISVLVVDDQPRFRVAVSRLLAGTTEFQVVGEAGTGEDAVRLAAILDPAVVVMDIRLPGLNGIEACRQITSEDPGTAVVLVSTYHGRDLPASAQSCGAAAYVPKARLGRAELLEIHACARHGRSFRVL